MRDREEKKKETNNNLKTALGLLYQSRILDLHNLVSSKR